MPVKPPEQGLDEVLFSISSNLGSARRVKSSQGSRRGTCGWITSFIYLKQVRRFAKIFDTYFFNFLNIDLTECLRKKMPNQILYEGHPLTVDGKPVVVHITSSSIERMLAEEENGLNW